MLEVKIIDDEEYEKNKTFTIHLGEPVLLEIGQKHGQYRSLAKPLFDTNTIIAKLSLGTEWVLCLILH